MFYVCKVPNQNYKLIILINQCLLASLLTNFKSPQRKKKEKKRQIRSERYNNVTTLQLLCRCELFKVHISFLSHFLVRFFNSSCETALSRSVARRS